MSEILPYFGVFIVGISVGAAGMWSFFMFSITSALREEAGDDNEPI